MVHICANALLCGAERRKQSRTAFFYAKHLGSFKTLKARPSVQVTTRLTKEHVQKSRTSNFVQHTFSLLRNGLNR